jgi:lysophospholipase L1-like esterase
VIAKRGFWIGGGLLVLLGLSLGLNLSLYRFAAGQYRDARALRLDPTAQGYFVAKNAELVAPAAGQARVIYFGDSRIAQWRRFPEVSGAQQVNRGRGGETTGQLRARLERDVLALTPDIVVIQAGVNDLTSIGLFPEARDGIVARCTTNLEWLVTRLRATGVDVVLTTILPAGAVPLQRRLVWSDQTRNAIVQVNETLRELAKRDAGVHLVDLDALFPEVRRMTPRFERDTLHMNASGYDALNARVGPVLIDLVKKPRNTD